MESIEYCSWQTLIQCSSQSNHTVSFDLLLDWLCQFQRKIIRANNRKGKKRSKYVKCKCERVLPLLSLTVVLSQRCTYSSMSLLNSPQDVLIRFSTVQSQSSPVAKYQLHLGGVSPWFTGGFAQLLHAVTGD